MKHTLVTLLILIPGMVFSQNSFSGMTLKKYKKVHALIIGVSDYTEVKPKLDYAHADARIMYRILSESFPEHKANMDTLINSDASQLRIVEAIRSLVLKAAEGDLVIFYFSGHGDVVEDVIDGEQGYFLAHNASKSRIYYPSGGAVDFAYVNKAMSRITDKKAEVWMITDACKSGKVINESGAANTMTSLNEGFKNTTKFVSCAAHELSFEDANIQQGVFTYYLVRALAGEADTDSHSGVLNIDEINSYMRTSVRKYTQEKQNPKVTSGNEFVDVLATNPEFSKLVKTIANGSTMNDLAMRGAKGDGPAKSIPLQKMEELLFQGKLHSSTDFAYEAFKSNKFGASPTDLASMKLLLTEALLDRGQRNTNLFLSGRPMIDASEDFKTTKKDFALAAELLGKDHPLYEQVIGRSQFFTAMEQIQLGKDLSVAETTLNTLLSKYPDAAHLHQGLALLYIKKADKSKAEASLNKAAEKVSTWTKPLNSQAYLNILAGKLDEAERYIASSQQVNKDEENALLLKASLHNANFELQHAEAALKSIKNASGDFSTSELKAMEGRINELRGRITVAQNLYKESLSSDQDNVELLIKLANLYKNEFDTVQALNYYKQAKRNDPNNPIIQANIDLLQKKTVMIDQQLINLSDVDAILFAVELFQDQKKYSEAVDLLLKATAVNNWNPDLLYELGKQQYSAGQEQASMESLKKALEISPYHFKSIRSLSYMYLHQKKYREADALIKKHDPYFTESAKYLALSYQVYRQMDSKNDLYPLLERAIKLDSLETDAYKALYQLHIEDNRYDEALREFRNLMNIGGGVADSIDFYVRVEKQVRRMIDQQYYQGQRSGIQLILDLDPYDFEMAYFMGLICYMEKDYEAASKAIQLFNKDIQSFSPAVQLEFYKLKAKINLETGHPDLSERLFSMTVGSTPPDYLGLAMAQFDQGKENWIQNFQRAGEPIDYNEDALKRYEKMRKKAGKSAPGYGGEQMRR